MKMSAEDLATVQNLFAAGLAAETLLGQILGSCGDCLPTQRRHVEDLRWSLEIGRVTLDRGVELIQERHACPHEVAAAVDIEGSE